MAQTSGSGRRSRGPPAPRQRQQPVAQRSLRSSNAGLQPPGPKGLAHAFNAFDKRHLPLDEVTAPYTTTNFTGTMEFDSATDQDQVIVVCPRLSQLQETYAGPLTDYIAMRYHGDDLISATLPAQQTLRSQIIDKPAPGPGAIYSSVRGRLHNLSVKLECLGTNMGLYPPGSAYIGTVPSLENGPTSLGATGISVGTGWASDAIDVGYLKSFSAASLVTKPVHLNASIAENIAYKSWKDFAVPAIGTEVGALSFSTALEPIIVYVPRAGAGDTVVKYRLVVGQQWCSRHPHNLMLRSTQVQHPATSPDLWHKAISAVKDIGPQLAERAGTGVVNALAKSWRESSGIYSEPFSLGM